MENEKQESQPKTENNEEVVRNSHRKMTMKELCEKHGIPYKNTTMESVGKFSIMPLYISESKPLDKIETPKSSDKIKTEEELNDSWGAFTRYANQ